MGRKRRVYSSDSSFCNYRALNSWLNSFTQSKLKFLLWIVGFEYIGLHAHKLVTYGGLEYQDLRTDVATMRKTDMIKLIINYHVISYNKLFQKSKSTTNKFDIMFDENADGISIGFFDCPICMEVNCPAKEKLTFNCEHNVCNSCYIEYLTNLTTTPCCFLCRERTKLVIFDNSVYKDEMQQRFI